MKETIEKRIGELQALRERVVASINQLQAKVNELTAQTNQAAAQLNAIDGAVSELSALIAPTSEEQT